METFSPSLHAGVFEERKDYREFEDVSLIVQENDCVLVLYWIIEMEAQLFNYFSVGCSFVIDQGSEKLSCPLIIYLYILLYCENSCKSKLQFDFCRRTYIVLYSPHFILFMKLKCTWNVQELEMIKFMLFPVFCFSFHFVIMF